MNTALVEGEKDCGVQESGQVKYKVVNNEKLREVSHRLIKKHIEAYKALANSHHSISY